MNTNSDIRKQEATGRARLIAAGFLGAFAASVLTVIYTGLMVEGSRSEFDAGFRSVTLAVGETLEVEVEFESPVAEAEARLEIRLPAPYVDFVGRPDVVRSTESVVLESGDNAFVVDIRAREAGSGYLVARIRGEEPIGLDRIFVTVTEE